MRGSCSSSSISSISRNKPSSRTSEITSSNPSSARKSSSSPHVSSRRMCSSSQSSTSPRSCDRPSMRLVIFRINSAKRDLDTGILVEVVEVVIGVSLSSSIREVVSVLLTRPLPVLPPPTGGTQRCRGPLVLSRSDLILNRRRVKLCRSLAMVDGGFGLSTLGPSDCVPPTEELLAPGVS